MGFECDAINLSHVLEEEILKPYVGDVRKANKAGIAKTMEHMVEETKAADFDHAYPSGRSHGTYARHMTHTGEDIGVDGYQETWHVKSPEHRLTHLVTKGHATVNGGRTKANPFLENAAKNAERVVLDNIEEEIG